MTKHFTPSHAIHFRSEASNTFPFPLFYLTSLSLILPNWTKWTLIQVVFQHKMIKLSFGKTALKRWTKPEIRWNRKLVDRSSPVLSPILRRGCWKIRMSIHLEDPMYYYYYYYCKNKDYSDNDTVSITKNVAVICFIVSFVKFLISFMLPKKNLCLPNWRYCLIPPAALPPLDPPLGMPTFYIVCCTRCTLGVLMLSHHLQIFNSVAHRV